MEKWKPHPTKENIFINQDDGLMYERLSSGWLNRLPGQKMTELQDIPQKIEHVTEKSFEVFCRFMKNSVQYLNAFV